MERGYLIGFHFDPMILYPGWEEKYHAVVSTIYGSLKPDRIMWISLGGFRYPRFLKPIIRERLSSEQDTLWRAFAWSGWKIPLPQNPSN